MEQHIIISKCLEKELAIAISECEHDRVFILVDETTADKCWPVISNFRYIKEDTLIKIKATDAHKDLKSLSYVWQQLSQGGATRHSCLINLGGGMVTDLGGFAASTFKRGIDFINIPTTLLAMVDASVGGKTGINFNGLKNEIGVFNTAHSVIIDTQFLQTSDIGNLRSGYGEMLKHGLISNDTLWQQLISFDLEQPNLSLLQSMVADSIKVKEQIVKQDPLEHGLRKALNLGHTIGHAFESLALKRQSPVLHGYAVAFGLICELYLSHIKSGFPVNKLRSTVNYIKEYYGMYTFTCDDYESLIELMKHDKKNVSGIINFTLLHDVGDIKINQTATKEEIFEAFDFFREGL